MTNKKSKTQKGFTLIELLVVISIIGVLASVVMTSLNSAKIKARDAVRRSDMRQILIAMETYYDSSGTYIIPGTGWNGCSCGWFNYQSGVYVKSVANGLEELGFFTEAPRDPSISSDNQTPQYMKYQCGNGFYIYAKLENPSASDQATFDNATCRPGCGMNYAVGHSN